METSIHQILSVLGVKIILTFYCLKLKSVERGMNASKKAAIHLECPEGQAVE